MKELSTVEVTTRYATTVETLMEAWAFIMDRLEKVGDDPEITISPVWTIYADNAGEEPVRRFSVVVSGMVEED